MFLAASGLTKYRPMTPRQLEKFGTRPEVRSALARFIADGTLQRRDSVQGRHRDTADAIARRAGNSAAAGINEKIVGVDHLRRLQWLKHYVLQRNTREIIFEIATVDVDLAATRSHANARNGSFSTTGGDKFLCLSHKN